MLLILLSALLALAGWARIEDNSYLLEEAYNQGPGVHQFVNSYASFPNEDSKDYVFEHEFSLGTSKHQGSYLIPIETSQGEIGNIQLGYRYQPYNRGGVLHGERFSLILPTNDGNIGGEFVHATSYEFHKNWTGHLNAGLDYIPETKTLISPILGASIVHHLRDHINILFEAILNETQFISDAGSKRTTSTLMLSPGISFDVFPGWKNTQVVSGIAFPMEILAANNGQGVFFYLSIEPDLKKP